MPVNPEITLSYQSFLFSWMINESTSLDIPGHRTEAKFLDATRAENPTRSIQHIHGMPCARGADDARYIAIFSGTIRRFSIYTSFMALMLGEIIYHQKVYIFAD
ncbi:hypothetical protein RCIA163 [Methanocella arvoryzae MRE50]|uniref:Uncharacterized protein n=1 Tax=Methanocella arvoryzae (strain DSM 22066 / NBRC 105507 / MRE50) TaxID=351160 RepID=Q0W2T2_METAR|nr:hypothetical protein RCIA163 [Methanocella arvoryzae MRE50]